MSDSTENEAINIELKEKKKKDRAKINSQAYRNKKKLTQMLDNKEEPLPTGVKINTNDDEMNNYDAMNNNFEIHTNVEMNIQHSSSNNEDIDYYNDKYFETSDEHDDDEDNEEDDTDDWYDAIDQNIHQRLYSNADIKLAEFNILFMSLITALNLPETHSERLYEFIKLILPNSSTMLETYYRFKTNFNYNLIKEIKLCHICQRELINKECPSETCSSHSLEKKIVLKKSIKVVTADIEAQIRLVLCNHYESIVKYKADLQNETMITDLCNGSNYKYEEDKISLILFTDAVTYTKSVSNKSMWACFSCIAELPPALRFSSENILFHSLWSSSFVDFQLYLKKYNKAIDNIIKTGIIWNERKIKVEILGFIADSPARSKAINSLQFNGKFGCIFCLHPTTRNSKNTTQIYPLLPDIHLRTNKDYNEQIKLATPEIPFKGIKGPTHLHEWLDIPSGVILDYMHLCLLGSFKTILTYILDNKNKKHDLGSGTFEISKYKISLIFNFI